MAPLGEVLKMGTTYRHVWRTLLPGKYAVIALAVLAIPAWPGDARAQVTALSLDDAIRLALINNERA